MKYLPTLFAYLACRILFLKAQNYTGCTRYYYSRGVLCCFKGTADNPTSYCPTKTQHNTVSPYPFTSCSYYSYSSTYSTKCCVYPSTQQHTSYSKYCPTTKVLASLCPGTTSCCTANVPVSIAGTTFYYGHRLCPGSTSKADNSLSIKSAYISAVVIVTGVGIISAIILTIVLINKYRQKRIYNQSEATIDSNEQDGITSGLEESVPSYEQVMKCIEVPPHIPGYTFDSKIVNTACVNSLCVHQQIELAGDHTNSITYANANCNVQDTDCDYDV